MSTSDTDQDNTDNYYSNSEDSEDYEIDFAEHEPTTGSRARTINPIAIPPRYENEAAFFRELTGSQEPERIINARRELFRALNPSPEPQSPSLPPQERSTRSRLIVTLNQTRQRRTIEEDDDENPFRYFPIPTGRAYLGEPNHDVRALNIGQPARPPPSTPPPSLVIEEGEADSNVRSIQEYVNISENLYQQDINEDTQYRNFIDFSLNGLEGGRRNSFTAIKEEDDDELFADFDIDALSIISAHIPADFRYHLPCSLYFRPNYDYTIKNNTFASIRLGPNEDRALFIKNIPNFLLLEFGFSARFKVNIFFPNLPHYTSRLYKISPENHIFFVDYILIPAVKLLTDRRFNITYPNSWFSEINRGSAQFTPYYLDYVYARGLSAALTTIIEEGQRNHLDLAERYSFFENFFFYTSTYGNKIGIVNTPDDIPYIQQVVNAFAEIDFNGIRPEYLYMDIAVNIYSVNRTGVFSYQEGYSPILDLFFNNVRITGMRYRHDEFASVRNLAGCRYRTFTSNGEGDFGILQLQAYHLIKSRFYQRKTTSFRHSFEISPTEARTGKRRAINMLNVLPQMIQEINNSTNGVRIEVTIQANNLQNYMVSVERVVINPIFEYDSNYIIWFNSNDMAHFLSVRLGSLTRLYYNIRQNYGTRADPRAMTIYAIISYLFRSLFSRPPDWSTDRYIRNIIERYRCNRSDLLLFQDFFVNDHDQWSCVEALSENHLQRIFNTGTGGFGRRPRPHGTVGAIYRDTGRSRMDPPPPRQYPAYVPQFTEEQIEETEEERTRRRRIRLHSPTPRDNILEGQNTFRAPSGTGRMASPDLRNRYVRREITVEPEFDQVESNEEEQLTLIVPMEIEEQMVEVAPTTNSHNINSFPALPEVSNIRFTFMPEYFRNSNFPIRNILNMFLGSSLDATLANTVINLFAQDVQYIFRNFNDYVRVNDPQMNLNHLSQESGFNTLFQRDLVHISQMNETTFKAAFRNVFPEPAHELSIEFRRINNGNQLIKNLNVRQAYIYFVINMIANNRAMDIRNFDRILHAQFTYMVRYMPDIRTNLSWRSARVRQGGVDNVLLFFGLNPRP